jgi:hypothetical protein
VKDDRTRAVGSEVFGDDFLSDGAVAPRPLVLGFVLEAEEQAADPRVDLASLGLATSSAAFVLTARTGARATPVAIFRLPRHVLPSATQDGS